MSGPTDEHKNEMNKIMEEWNANHNEESYDPIPFLVSLSEKFEKEAEGFHKQDPDPFDDRHPVYMMPSCSYGKLLKALAKQETFLEALVDKYLKSRSGTTSDKSGPSLAEATARLLLSVMPGLDALSIFSSDSSILPYLYKWATEASEPLRTYATGILAAAVEHQDINADHHTENTALVPVLLKRLWSMIDPDKYPVEDVNNEDPSSSKSFEQGKKSTHKGKTRQKRKLAGNDTAKKAKLRKLDDSKSTADPISKPTDEDSASPVEDPLCISKLCSTSVASLPGSVISAPSTSDLAGTDVSNSSWVDMMPVVIGCSFSLAPPLKSSISARFILNFLTPLGEYQDLLSVFIEHQALDLVKYYLDKSSTNDGLLTFSALRFFGSLLCHNKIATAFIDNNGIQRLLSVRRPSMGATGVSLCLYYLAYNQDAMERVCLLPKEMLHELVKYATWLLECSHESGRCHAALFFSISFQFRVILRLFDQKNGLRYLVNMLSTLNILRPSEDRPLDESDDDMYTLRQAARNTCATIKKYFETHLAIKVKSINSLSASNRTSGGQWQHDDKNSVGDKIVDCDQEKVIEYLEFLLNIDDAETRPGISVINNWQPLQNFMRLDGIRLLLQLIAFACDWSTFNGRAETVRSALDCLAVVTLSPKAQAQLCEPVNLPPSLTEETGISIILGVAEGDAYLGNEPEAQKSALAVIINCVCGPQEKFDGAMARVVNGTPLSKLVAKSPDENRKKLWECVKTNNGIKILLQLLMINQPSVHADAIRLLACRALCGLSRCESVKQIISKLPSFNNGQIQFLARQPIMQDKRKEHARFCQYMKKLTTRVSGKPSSSHMDLDSSLKAHIVSQTVIRYDNRELLQLMHNHLTWSGLHSSAAALAREASLHIPTTISTGVYSTPKSSLRNALGAGDASSSPTARRISFTKGSHAAGDTPTLSPHSSLFFTPSQKKFRSKLKSEGALSTPTDASTALAVPQRCRLSANGRITVVQPGMMDILRENDQHSPGSPITLNTIVVDYLTNQHARCKNPVVTVPEFSLVRKHYCPEPRFRVEAPINISSRCMRRHITPRCGGIGGAACDRQFIYSRFRPSVVFRAPDEESIPYTCCSFTPDDTEVILGNYQGDITIRSLLTDEDRVIEGCANAPIVRIEPARDGKRMLLVAEGVWRNECGLFLMDTLESKLTYDDAYYIEFSKSIQDRVIGTKNSSSTIYDAETGQKIQTLERSDLANHYSRNKATFSYDDELVLSDGLLWDVRISGSKPIHKFDKFGGNASGLFHPQGLEVIINAEVWDLRNYHLLHTVPCLNDCTIRFNSEGSVLYAAQTVAHLDVEDDMDDGDSPGSKTFQAIDAHQYCPISITDTKHRIYDFAADGKDCYVAVIERQPVDRHWELPSLSVCRMYEVGKKRGDDDEDDDDDENNVVANDNDDDDDNPNDDDDDDDDDDGFLDSLSGSDQDMDMESPSYLSPWLDTGSELSSVTDSDDHDDDDGQSNDSGDSV